MSILGDSAGVAMDQILALAGTVSGTWTQGSNTKTVSGWTRDRRRTSSQSGPGAGTDREEQRLVFRAAQFLTGFSGANPVIPAAGDTWTDSDGLVWTVSEDEAIDRYGQGAVWSITVGREVQRGTA